MRRPRAPAALFTLWFAVAAAATFLAWANRSFTFDLRSLDSSDFVYVVGSAIFTFVFAVVGTAVASRTRHAIGWLLVAIAVGWMLPLLLEQYSLRTLVTAPGSLPAARWAVWTGDWIFPLPLPPLILVLLLFPTGTVRSKRWRPLAIAAPVAGGLLMMSAALKPGAFVGNLPRGVVVTNPLGLRGAAALLGAATTIGGMASVALAIAGVVCIALRFRVSRGVERQQIKWLAFVAEAAVLIVLVDTVAGRIAKGTGAHDAIDSIFWGVLVTTVMLGMPLAIGAAILRYRLFDIDRIISRTVSYAIVSAILVGTFALVVLLPTSLVGSGRAPGWLVAAGTLAVFGLLRPLRRRVQDAVDHRFNRRRYDAERTIDAFTARLREEIDIDALGAELRTVVNDTMRPNHVSLWIATKGRPGTP